MGDYYPTRLAEIDGAIAAAQATVGEIYGAIAAIDEELAAMNAAANKPADQMQPGEIIEAVRAKQRLETEGPALKRARRDLEKRRDAVHMQTLEPAQRRRQTVSEEAVLPARAIERAQLVLATLEALEAGSNGNRHSDELLKLCRLTLQGLRQAAELLAR